MRSWFDTEFIEDGKTIELISIGAIREDGMNFYAEIEEADLSRANPWVREHVLPHLTGGFKVPRARVASELVGFFGEKPEIWAYYGAYDWVALCQLYGTMMQLPKGWPMWVRDVKQLADSLGNPALPIRAEGTEHHAHADACWTRRAWEHLQGIANRQNTARRMNERWLG